MTLGSEAPREGRKPPETARRTAPNLADSVPIRREPGRAVESTVGKRGPTPLPPSIALLHGDRSAARQSPSPQPRARLPVAPRDLSPEARVVWRHVVREMTDTGVLRSADRDLLRCYCEAVVRYVQTQDLLARSGPVVVGARSRELVRNPLHQITRDNADQVRMLARELYLTPLARSGMPSVAEQDAEDPFEAWRTGRAM